MELDNIDKKIISELEKNARTPFLKIAQQLKVSEGTIRKRVAKLVKNEVIKKFTIELRHTSKVIIGIETNPHIPTNDIVKELQKLDVRKVFEVAGRYDIVCTLGRKNLEEVNEILERIRIMKGIEHTETFTVLKEN